MLHPSPFAGRPRDQPLRLEPVGECAKRLVALEGRDGQVVCRRVGGFRDRAQGIPLRERRADGRERAVRAAVVAPLGPLEESSGGLLVCHGFYYISLRI